MKNRCSPSPPRLACDEKAFTCEPSESFSSLRRQSSSRHDKKCIVEWGTQFKQRVAVESHIATNLIKFLNKTEKFGNFFFSSVRFGRRKSLTTSKLVCGNIVRMNFHFKCDTFLSKRERRRNDMEGTSARQQKTRNINEKKFPWNF